MPSISVIIPAFNAAKDIKRAIDSCLGQTLKPLEIIVVDDGSSDDTARMVQLYSEPVRLLSKENGGPGSARNLGARSARGEWIAFLDADDEWHPQKLERQAALDTSSGIGIIHGLVNTSQPRIPDTMDFRLLWKNNLIGTSATLIRKSVLHNLGGFNEDRRLISVEDYNLWLRVAHAGWQIVTCQYIHTFYTSGIGLSSHTESFLKASLFNIDLLQRELALPARMCSRKRRQICDAFGSVALYERNTALARSLFAKSFMAAPSPRRACLFAMACIPVTVLNLRRRLAAHRQKAAPSHQ